MTKATASLNVATADLQKAVETRENKSPDGFTEAEKAAAGEIISYLSTLEENAGTVTEGEFVSAYLFDARTRADSGTGKVLRYSPETNAFQLLGARPSYCTHPTQAMAYSVRYNMWREVGEALQDLFGYTVADGRRVEIQENYVLLRYYGAPSPKSASPKPVASKPVPPGASVVIVGGPAEEDTGDIDELLDTGEGEEPTLEDAAAEAQMLEQALIDLELEELPENFDYEILSKRASYEYDEFGGISQDKYTEIVRQEIDRARFKSWKGD